MPHFHAGGGRGSKDKGWFSLEAASACESNRSDQSPTNIEDELEKFIQEVEALTHDADGHPASDKFFEVEKELMLLQQRLTRRQQGLPPLELKSFKADGIERPLSKRGAKSGKLRPISKLELEAKASKVRADMADFHYRLLDWEASLGPPKEEKAPPKPCQRNVSQEWVQDFLTPGAAEKVQVDECCSTQDCYIGSGSDERALVPLKQSQAANPGAHLGPNLSSEGLPRDSPMALTRYQKEAVPLEVDMNLLEDPPASCGVALDGPEKAWLCACRLHSPWS
mmetsp:Transcript_37165/g.69194  ORF Transcript_37165/g.69194 Transcript_37165/m.69194 type:complete len:281 (+) Transcript_37165:253-1095(+)